MAEDLAEHDAAGSLGARSRRCRPASTTRGGTGTGELAADVLWAWFAGRGTTVGMTVMQGRRQPGSSTIDWIAAWWEQAASTYTADVALAAGDHTLRYEFYETGGATAQLSWAFATEPAPMPDAAAGGTLGTVPGTTAGPAGRAAGVLLGVLALVGFASRAVRRRWLASEPRARLRRSRGGGHAAGGAPPAARPVLARVSATALLLTAMLLVPATARAQIPTQQVEYYHTDALGTVRAVTKQVNGQWQVVARHDFMPFGEEIAPPTPPQNKRLFTGKERDSETGMDYFGARYLRADLGRFTTMDPVYTWSENLVDPQRWNRYSYVRNNPLRWTDPTGEAIETLWDIANVVMGAKSVYENFKAGRYAAAAVDAVGVVLDAGAGAVPGLPGGAGTAIKTARALERADDLLDTAKGGTYILRDVDGVVMRTGRSNNLERRMADHARDAKTKDLKFEE